LGVPKLLGVSQADITSNWSYSREFSRVRQSGQDHTTVFMELEGPSPEEFIPGSMVWWRVVSANASASIMSSYSSYGFGGGHWTGSEGMTQGSYTGPLSLRVEPRLSFFLRDGGGLFSTLGEPVAAWSAESSGTVTERSGNGVATRSFSDIVTQDPFMQPLQSSSVDFTAPKAVRPFSGRLFVEGLTGDGTGREGEGSFQRTASFQFWPDWNDLEVEVEIEDSTQLSSTNPPGASYRNWRPEGNLEAPEQGGPRPLRLKATLKPKAESPTPEQLAAMPPVRRFRFEMSEVSREPGVCMNWPVPPGTNAPPDDPEFDLRFIATVPEAMVLSPKKSKAGVIPLPGADPNLPSAWVLLECFDFGAHANLQVYAELADGREIVGHLKVGEEKRYLIPIPDREPESLVARKWREDNKVKGGNAEDLDDQPEGDGQKGDGFSVYEEYRGFRVNGKHVSPDPWIKNLFVRNINEGPVAAGCRMIESSTVVGDRKGLKIYDELKAEEWVVSRVMNLNRSKSAPRSSDEYQHGLLVRPNPVTNALASSYSDRIAFPRRPKNVLSLVVAPSDNTAETVAHELTHAIGCAHHGDTDYYAYWSVVQTNSVPYRRWMEQRMDSDGKTGTLVPLGRATPITVYVEGSRNPKWPNQDTNAPLPKRSLKYIAQRGGEDSGQEDCYMRYSIAGAYIPRGRPNDRIEAAQNIVGGDDAAAYYVLCRSCKGTGVNPERYGNATIGNCLGQICVRDSAPDRPITPGLCPDPALPPGNPGNAAAVPFSLASGRATLAAPLPNQGPPGILIVDVQGNGTGTKAARGWPLHLVWHALQKGRADENLTLTGANGATLTVKAISPGQWWLSPDQTRGLSPGAVSARVGSVSVSLTVVDPPADPISPSQDQERRRSFIQFHLATGQAEEARREAEDWIAADPASPTPRAMLAEALAALGQPRESLDAYEEFFDRVLWFERSPQGLFQKYNKVYGDWLSQLPDAPPDPVEPPEPLTLEDQDRVYGADTNGQWAATATASSEYRTSGDYSASRATGAPDVARYGDNLKAWASRLADSGPEWLELTFTNAVVAQAVRVRQVFNPGAINRIEVYDAAGVASTVFSGLDTNRYPANQIAWFVAKFPPTLQPVKRVRVWLDSVRVKGWNEIDAVQLVAAPALPTPAPRLSYTYQTATGTLEIGAWPSGFVLQRATRLAPADWQNFATQAPVSVPIAGSPAFFRLVQSP
jgi:hypothetical protein